MTTKFHFLNDGGVAIEQIEDVEPVLEYAKERARAGFGRSASGELHEVAHFPANIIAAYCQDKGITFSEFMADDAHVKAMLADPALRDFQVCAQNPHKLIRGA